MRRFQVALCENYYTQNSSGNLVELAWEWKVSPVTQPKDTAHCMNTAFYKQHITQGWGFGQCTHDP